MQNERRSRRIDYEGEKCIVKKCEKSDLLMTHSFDDMIMKERRVVSVE